MTQMFKIDQLSKWLFYVLFFCIIWHSPAIKSAKSQSIHNTHCVVSVLSYPRVSKSEIDG